MADLATSPENQRQRCTPLTKVITSVCAGILLCIIGIVSYATFPPILEQQVKANLIIDPANEVYESWREAPIPIFVKMYLFNYTNSEEVMQHGAKPRVQQLGPYTYREYRKKVNVTFAKNGTVSYRQVLSYEFLPNITSGSLDDEVYTLNVPIIGAAFKNGGFSEEERLPMAKGLQEMFANYNQSVFMKRKVRELLFEGYPDEMMSVAKTLGWSHTDKFAYQIDRNNSNDGVYTIFTGAKGMDRYGFVDRWQGKQRVSGFRKPCSYINGTTGDMWPPYSITPNTSPTFFVSHLCRSLSLSFEKNESVKGIKVLRFRMDENVFNNDLKENKCYCRKKDSQSICFPNGVLDLSRCQRDAPLVVSLPHFRHAHSSLISAIDGINPQEESHDFYMDIEPVMGIPIRVSAKLQMNVIVDSFEHFSMFENLSSSFWPTFWLETTATVNDDMAGKIRLVTEDLANYVTLAASFWIFLGVFVIMSTFAYMISQHCKKRRARPSSSHYTAVKLVRTRR